MHNSVQVASSADKPRKLTSRFTAPCLLPERTCLMWGQPHRVQPALGSHVFGKGDLLIGLAPTSHRPKYYLVWVDSSWFDNIRDYLEDIWLSLESDFGLWDAEDGALYQWPMLDGDSDCSWWMADSSDVLPPAANVELETLLAACAPTA